MCASRKFRMIISEACPPRWVKISKQNSISSCVNPTLDNEALPDRLAEVKARNVLSASPSSPTYASESWPLPHPLALGVWAGCPSQTCLAECLMTGCLWNSCVLFVPSPHPGPCWQCRYCATAGALALFCPPHWSQCRSRERALTHLCPFCASICWLTWPLFDFFWGVLDV